MKEEIIFIQGSVTGYFIYSSNYHTGNYAINDLHLYSADIRDSIVIADTLIDEHCVGTYYKPTKYHDLRFFTSETEFFKSRLRDFVIRDIETSDLIQEGEKKLIPFKGIFISKITKPLPPPTPLDKKGNPIVNPKAGWFGSGLGADIGTVIGINDGPDLSGNGGCFTKFWEPVRRTFFQNKISVDQQNTTKTQPGFLANLIAWCIMIGIGAVLIKFFSLIGLDTYATVFVGYILFALLWDQLTSKFEWFKRFGVDKERMIWHNLASFFWVFALPSLWKNGWQFGNFHLFLFGLWMLLISRKMSLLRLLGYGVIIFQLIYFINQLRAKFDADENKEDREYVEPDDDQFLPEAEVDSSKVVLNEKDTIEFQYMVHNHSWRDNNSAYYRGTFKIRQDHFSLSRLQRERLTVDAQTATQYWNRIYKRLSSDDSEFLDKICKEYVRIIKSKKLSRQQSADMIVTSIQNIPYYLVHELSHRQADREFGGFITEYHMTGGPCLSEIKFGLQSPTEFMGNFKGDCDTRSVMLYTVLNRLGLKAIVLASDHYGHAILGIAGNYRGKSIRYSGEDYYVWETTATGFRPGVLSDECGNMRYWYVALGN